MQSVTQKHAQLVNLSQPQNQKSFYGGCCYTAWQRRGIIEQKEGQVKLLIKLYHEMIKYIMGYFHSHTSPQ